MYILTDYRLIMTKEKKDRRDLSPERALQNNKQQLSKRKSQLTNSVSLVRQRTIGERKIGRWSQMSA
jgi:hypothetical protein